MRAFLYKFIYLIIITSFMSVSSYAKTDKDLAATTVVMIKAYGQENNKIQYGAGVIIGSDEDFIYIMTAAHVTYDGDAAKVIVKLQQQPNKEYIATILDHTLEVGEDSRDFGVIKIASFDSFKMPGVSSISHRETPERVHLIGQPGVSSPWSYTQLLDAYQLHDEYSGNYTFVGMNSQNKPLVGYSGGGVFDDDWRLAGIHLKDSVFYEESTDVSAVFLSLNWIRERLKRFDLPLAPHMKGIEEGPLPKEYAGYYTPTVLPILYRHQLGMKVFLSTTVLNNPLSDASVNVYVKKSGKWIKAAGHDLDMISGLNNQDNFYVPGDSESVNVCTSHRLPNNAFAYSYTTFLDIKKPISMTGLSPAFDKKGQNINQQTWLQSTREDPCSKVLQQLNLGNLQVFDKPPVAASKSRDLEELVIPTSVYLGRKVPDPWNKSGNSQSYLNVTFDYVKAMKLGENIKFDVYLTLESENEDLNIKIDEQFYSHYELSVPLENEISDVESLTTCSVHKVDDAYIGVTQNYQDGKVNESARRGLFEVLVEFATDIGDNGVVITEGKTHKEACNLDTDSYVVLKPVQKKLAPNADKSKQMLDKMKSDMMKSMQEQMKKLSY